MRTIYCVCLCFASFLLLSEPFLPAIPHVWEVTLWIGMLYVCMNDVISLPFFPAAFSSSTQKDVI